MKAVLHSIKLSPLFLSLSVFAQNPDCNQLQSSDFSFENIPCEANNLVVSALNEIPDATYTWNFGDGNTADGLTAENHYNNTGSYSVSQTVSLAGCPSNTISKTIDVEVFRPFTFNIGKNEKVCNPNEALAFVTYYGGKTPFTYQWSNGDKNRIARGLTSGEYSVTITDANGCQQIGSVELDVVLSPPMDITFNKKEEVCDPNETYLQANVTGGIQPLTYFWSNGETSDKIEGIGSDFYYVEVYDAIGCSQFMYDFFNVSQAPAITLTTQTNETVCNPTDASAKALASGGTPPFNYAWNTGATTAEISGIESGSYAVNVTDAAGCSASKSFQTNVIVSPTIQIDFDKKEQVCEPNEATIEALVSGGTGDLSINWNTGDQTAQLTAVTSGNYAIDVTDQLGCTASASTSFEVNISPKMIAGIYQPTVICNSSDASLTAVVKGGTSPLSVTWNTGQTDFKIESLNEGNYSYTVTDQYGCVAQAEGIIAYTPTPEAPKVETQVICESGSASLFTNCEAETIHWSTTPQYVNCSKGSTFTTPAIDESTVFYVGADNQGCFSAMTAVEVIVQKREDLVNNGGFEIGHEQLKYGRIEKADGWFSAAGTPDVFDASNLCDGECSNNGVGKHHHITPAGERFAGIHAVSMDNTNAKTKNAAGKDRKVEAIATALTSVMEIGTNYTIQFQVAQSEKHIHPENSNYPFENASSSKFAVKLSESDPSSNGYNPTTADVVFVSSTSSVDTWETITFNFTAEKSYKYIVIESIIPSSAQTSTSADGTVYSKNGKSAGAKVQSYMLIDQVSVLEDCDGNSGDGIARSSAESNDYQSKNNLNSLFTSSNAQDLLEATLTVAPNPNNGNFQLFFELADLSDRIEVKTNNAVGQLVAHDTYTSVPSGRNGIAIDNNQLTPGIYSITILNGNQTATKRFIVQ